jgi:hypothetical protein
MVTLTFLGSSNMWSSWITGFPWASLVDSQNSELILIAFNQVQNFTLGGVTLSLGTLLPDRTESKEVVD